MATTQKENYGIISFPLSRPVTTVMIFLTIFVFGWRSYQRLPINLMPEISYPTLTVRTEFEGAAPEDVEKLVTRPLEEMLSIVSGLVEISSVSSAGLSEITLEFLWNIDMNVAQQDVRDRLDLFEPPKEVTKKPIILRFNPNLDPVIRIGFTPPHNLSEEDKKRYLTTLRESVQKKLKSDLEAESGIAQVTVKGGQEEEIQILVDNKIIKSLGISLEDVVNSLASQNINVAGGKLLEGKTEYIVRTLKEFKNLDDIKNVIITTSSSPLTNIKQGLSLSPNIQPLSGATKGITNISNLPSTIRLKDIANVVWGTKERDSIIRINGEEAVEIEIYKEGDSNTVNVCNLVKDLLGIERKKSLSEIIDEKISLGLKPVARDSEGKHELSDSPSSRREEMKKKNILSSLPPDVKVHIISDQSQFIISSIEEVQNAAINGGFLALLILFLFLRDIRSTITIGFAIPISVIAAFLPMFMRGISLNIMSLGGIALGIGMLVDNSIVVLESIFRCREEGDDIRRSALRGTYEVSSAVIASTLTTVAVFFPVSFVEGIAGQLFRDLSLTVTFSLLASLLVALFLNPLFVSNTFTISYSSKKIILPVRIFNFYRVVKRESFSSAVIKSILYLTRKYLENTFVNLINTFRFTRSLTLLSAPIILFDVLFKTISWFLIFIIFYPLTILVSILLLPTILVVWLTVKAISYVLKIILYLPLTTFNFLFESLRIFYKYSLKNSLPYGPLFLIITLVLFVYSLSLLPRLGQELIPTLKQGEFSILYETKAGTKLEQTLEKAKRIENILMSHPLVETVTLQVGSESSKSESKGRNENKGTFTVLLKDRKSTTKIQDAIIEELRNKISPLPEENIVFTLPSLFSLKTNLEVQIFGDDLDMLRKVGERCIDVIKKINGVKDAELSIQPGYPEILIQFDNELLSEKGLTPAQVANTLRREIQGEIATKFNRGGDKIDIRVRTDQIYLKNLEDLRQLPITEGSTPIRLCDIAKITESVGPSDIRRIGQKRTAIITANIQGRDLGSVSEEVMNKLREVEKPREFFITLGGQNRELTTSYQSLRFALFLAVFLVYVVMASQFESIWLPFLVMFSVPLAFIGVILILYITNTSLSVTVFLGSIVLAGIVVNNAIVLIDYTNQLLKRGFSLSDAIVTAGTVRLRPILMTTLTTVLGLLPMLISGGEGSELRYPLALTIVTGLSSSTLLTLWIIPMANYMFSSMIGKATKR